MASNKQRVIAKQRVIEHLYEKYCDGLIPDGIVTSDQIVEAIDATKAKLSKNNPANFLKDIIRSKNANANWPNSLKADKITARQRYGNKRVFQFTKYPTGASEPFPDRFIPGPTTKRHTVQSASIPSVARALGRHEESWLTQVIVNLRIIETQLSIFSPTKNDLKDVAHLQMSVKTQPEIDAVFLASFSKGKTAKSSADRHVLVTCEAKHRDERILEDQIREQIAKAMEITASLNEPNISAIKPTAVQVIMDKIDERRIPGIYLLEFKEITRNDFKNKYAPTTSNSERLYSLPLIPVSDVIYFVEPPIPGLS